MLCPTDATNHATPYYLRPLERAVHIGSSTNTWGPLKPSQMWNFDVVQARLKLNRFCPQLPGKHCSLGQRVPDLSSLQYITVADYSHPRRTHTSDYYPLPSQRAPQAGAFWVTSRRSSNSASCAGCENTPGSTASREEAPCPPRALGAPRPRQMMRIDKLRSLIQAPRSR